MRTINPHDQPSGLSGSVHAGRVRIGSARCRRWLVADTFRSGDVLLGAETMALASTERRKFKGAVFRALEKSFGDLGWTATPWRRTGRFFTQPGPVTPYLLVCDFAGRRWGSYVVDGAFGVIHRSFEQSWGSAATEADESALRTVSLHTANFRELDDTRYIDPGNDIQSQVSSFCEATLKVLHSLPSTEAGLASAMRENKLVGHPFDSYFAPAALHPELNPKQLAFRRYLEGLPRG